MDSIKILIHIIYFFRSSIEIKAVVNIIIMSNFRVCVYTKIKRSINENVQKVLLARTTENVEILVLTSSSVYSH